LNKEGVYQCKKHGSTGLSCLRSITLNIEELYWSLQGVICVMDGRSKSQEPAPQPRKPERNERLLSPSHSMPSSPLPRGRDLEIVDVCNEYILPIPSILPDGYVMNAHSFQNHEDVFVAC
jgi:hypothetical protein